VNPLGGLLSLGPAFSAAEFSSLSAACTGNARSKQAMAMQTGARNFLIRFLLVCRVAGSLVSSWREIRVSARKKLVEHSCKAFLWGSYLPCPARIHLWTCFHEGAAFARARSLPKMSPPK